MKPSTYLPTLDGWRALSIALVILHHSTLQCAMPILGAVLHSLNNIGEIGVEIFFAISGLLICSRLLDEESRLGHINVKSFYIRRCFRILPAAILYLAVIAILAGFHIIPLWPLDWFGALLFFRNYAMVFEYVHHSPLALHWYTGHFWSLSMEEHFYLVLPGVLVLFKKRRVSILASLILVIALWRFLLTHILHNNYQINFRTDTHADALLIPAVLALLLYPLLRRPLTPQYIPAWSFPLILAAEMVLLLYPKIPFFSTLQATLLPLLILSTVLHPRALPGRALEAKPVRWMGFISYSFYLWQQLFFGDNFVRSTPQLILLRKPPINLIALVLCACFSYYLVEKPFIRLGHRFANATAERQRDNVTRIGTRGRDLPAPVRYPG